MAKIPIDRDEIRLNSTPTGLSSDPRLVMQKLVTHYTLDDIVLPAETRAQLSEICEHVTYRKKVLNEWPGSKVLIDKGIHVLFSGRPGTGKTMAAQVIANTLGRPLYRIDLAQVVSKYIGETEKNLHQVFNAAEEAKVILLFDEADALFGNRSESSDAHDRYANIEITYLLQRLEAHEGLAILTTNQLENIDPTFVLRLDFVVHFPAPDEQSRKSIWDSMWAHGMKLADDVDTKALAQQFELTGGEIHKVAQAATFLALEEDKSVTLQHILQAVKREDP